MRNLLFLWAFSSSIVCAQSSDAVLWTGFGLDLDVTKVFSLEAESQIRVDQNMSRMITTYGEFGVKSKIVRGINVGLIYRYARKNEGDYYFNENRFCLDASYRYKTEIGVYLKTRLRYQHSFDRFREINGVYPNRKNIFRLALRVAYKNADFKLIQPYLGTEFFYIAQPANQTSLFIDTYRIKAGVNIDLPKRFSLKIFYLFEHENRNEDNRYHIYGLQCNYSFKALYKGKEKETKRTPLH